MPDPKPMVKPARFVELLEREVRRGFSVIPLVGSGLSAPSGVLTGEAFGSYLLCCVWDALRKPSRQERVLSLKDGVWPQVYPPDEINTARAWIADLATQLRENYPARGVAIFPTPPIRRAQLLPLEQEAIGALADWRSTLFFLSRLRSTNHGKCPSLYDDLGPPDPKVVDSFNHHITRGHTYNLGHQMLSFLTRLLRIRTVLTTNFDTLLEQAFAVAHLRLDVFDVHLAGSLPDPRLVRSQLSLIKLHGSRFETRADLSLDSAPSEEDRKSFVRYFQGDGASLPAHLLVLGFSGRDRRIISLMSELASRNGDADPSMIFWVCHRSEDVARVIELAQRFEFASSITVTAGRADLLLFELYQRFVSTLPPAGSTYEFAQYTPPLAVSLYRDQPEPLTTFLRVINEKASSWAGPNVWIDCESSPGEAAPGRFIVVRGASGISSLAELAFTRLTADGRNALWFELDDFCGVDDLEACILQCIAAQRGQLDLNVVTLSPHDLDQEAVRRHFHIESREWVLFLYGRQSAGTSAGWDNRPWPAQEFDRLWELVRVLEKIGFTIIYLPLSSYRHRSIIRSIRRVLKVPDSAELAGGARQLVDTFVVDPCLRKHPEDDADAESLLAREPADVLKEVAKWSHSGGTGTDLLEKRCRFLYVMTLFRQSRHLSALASEAALPDPARFNTDGLDNDRVRMDEVERWTSELADLGLLRRKEGGFLWMHRDLRETLRILLEEPHYGWIPGTTSFLPKRSRSHHWLAEWYLRAFRATGNFTPFVESFYHRLQCILHLEEAEVPKHLRKEYLHVAGPDETNAQEKYRGVECEINLREAAKLLNSGKRVPVLNLEEVQRKALFSKLPPGLEPIARKYNCLPLYEDLDNIRGRLRTLASLQSRDPESVSGALAASSGARLYAQRSALPAEEINAWEAEYTRIKARVPFDQFSRTRGELIDLLNRLGFSIAGQANPDSIRRATVDSIVNQRPSVQWRLIIKVLRRLAHLYLKETAIAYHLHEIDGWTDWVERGALPGTSDAKHHAATASSLLLAAERSGWFLDPSFRDSQMIESVACLSLHGLALGYLDRFTEAQRKIDEASGSLASSSLAHDPLELAIIELRRASLFLLEARSIRVHRSVPNTKPIDLADAPRSASARVEDAWRCVERAHELLSGNSRIVSWWERLYTTQLRALAMNEELYRVDPRYRALLGYPDSSCEESATLAYRSALLLRPRRTRVVARACHYYFLAADEPNRRKRAVARCLEILYREKKRLADTLDGDRPDPIVLDYFHGVLKRLSEGAG
jgi:hypothetical protein